MPIMLHYWRSTKCTWKWCMCISMSHLQSALCGLQE